MVAERKRRNLTLNFVYKKQQTVRSLCSCMAQNFGVVANKLGKGTSSNIAFSSSSSFSKINAGQDELGFCHIAFPVFSVQPKLQFGLYCCTKFACLDCLFSFWIIVLQF